MIRRSFVLSNSQYVREQYPIPNTAALVDFDSPELLIDARHDYVERGGR